MSQGCSTRRHGAVLADEGTILLAGSEDRIPGKLLDSCRRIRVPGNHPFPSRTRKLSAAAPMVLLFEGGRVGHCQAFYCRLKLLVVGFTSSRKVSVHLFLSASVAQ